MFKNGCQFLMDFHVTDFHNLMLVAESMSAVLFPFIWQHVYVPILPPALSHFLDAPVPFLMGIYCSSEEDKKNLALPSEVHVNVTVGVEGTKDVKSIPQLFCFLVCLTCEFLSYLAQGHLHPFVNFIHLFEC